MNYFFEKVSRKHAERDKYRKQITILFLVVVLLNFGLILNSVIQKILNGEKKADPNDFFFQVDGFVLDNISMCQDPTHFVNTLYEVILWLIFIRFI